MFNISINDLEKIIVGPGCLKFPLERIGAPNTRSNLAKLGYTNEFQVKLRFNEVLCEGNPPLHFLTPGSDGTVGELIEAVEKVLKNKLLLEGRFKTVSGPESDFEGDELLVRKETFGDNLPCTFRAPDLNRVSEVTSNDLRVPLNLQKFYSHLMQWLSCHGLSIDDVSVSHGGSMLLLGLIETTDDIDLTVSSEIFNGFDNGNHEIRPLENNRYLIKVGKRVDIHTSELHPLQLQSCLVKHPNGIWYRNAQQTLIDYLTLGRDKDQEKIQSLLKLCAHSSKDLTYRYGEAVGRGENIAGIPPTIEDPEALVELGTAMGIVLAPDTTGIQVEIKREEKNGK